MNVADTLQITTPSDREIVITRSFDAPRTLVFDALTKPELVKRWLLGPPGWTMPVCEIDLRVGGKYRFVWHKDDGSEMALGGVHREIVVPQRIVRTEVFEPDWTGGETLTTAELSEHDGRTTLITTVLHASRETRDGALFSGMKEGLEMGYQRLDELLESMG